METTAGTVVLSALGLDSTKIWSGVTRAAYRLDVGSHEWREIAPAPGPPRLAATAQTHGGRIYVFGGYTVAESGAEASVPHVVSYDPGSDRWERHADMPTPVDDVVSGVWRDSLIFIVSGWHDTDNVAAVQIYDPARDAWEQATPIPGPPVFGHTGGIAGDQIIYVDGARVDQNPRRFSLESSSWLGTIDPANPTDIEWSRVEDHPGDPLYRGAALGSETEVVFFGGADNTYNYNGIGYDGNPSEPLQLAFAWDTTGGAWRTYRTSAATMDHRGLIEVDGELFVVGGMASGQRVTAEVTRVDITR